MKGIFGCFDQNNIEEHLHDFMCSIEETGYCISDQVLNDSCIIGTLNTHDSNVKNATIKESGLFVVICAEEINECVNSLGMKIIRMYKDNQFELLKKVNGSFAAAIYDIDEEKITLINDRYGLIKIFYYSNCNSFYFCPKIKPLVSCNLDICLRNDSIFDFFVFGYILGDKTFFNKIHQLPPASILECSKGDLKLTKYWNYEYDEEYSTISEEDLIEELGYLWQQAVERRIQRNEKVLIPLSGGLDSRAILAAALKCISKNNIITFTYGNPGSFDFEIGRMIAKKVGVKNVVLRTEKDSFEEQYLLSIDDIEGMIDATPYFPIKNYKEITKYGNNILSGYIGDFVMGSHMYQEMLTKNIETNNDIQINNLFLKYESLHDVELIIKIFNNLFYRQSSYSLPSFQINNNKNLSNIFFHFFFENHTNNYSYFAVFRNRELFNYRTPFLDTDLVDFMLTIPPDLRYKQKLYRSMLIKRYPHLFTLPTKNNLGLGLNASYSSLFLMRSTSYLKMQTNALMHIFSDQNIFQNKNDNYMNYDELLRNNEEYNMIIKKFLSKLQKRDFFNCNFIEDIWRLHMKGDKNYSMLFGLLATFELFLSNYVDKK